MNKNGLYNALGNNFKNTLDLFFESNVCVPKGENRHPDADVLHLGLEGAPFQWSYKGNEIWNDEYYALAGEIKYRIKPSEPIYEWQWVLIQEHHQNILSEYMTNDEINNIHEMVTCIKIEETKRERK